MLYNGCAFYSIQYAVSNKNKTLFRAKVFAEYAVSNQNRFFLRAKVLGERTRRIRSLAMTLYLFFNTSATKCQDQQDFCQASSISLFPLNFLKHKKLNGLVTKIAWHNFWACVREYRTKDKAHASIENMDVLTWIDPTIKQIISILFEVLYVRSGNQGACIYATLKQNLELSCLTTWERNRGILRQ